MDSPKKAEIVDSHCLEVCEHVYSHCMHILTNTKWLTRDTRVFSLRSEQRVYMYYQITVQNTEEVITQSTAQQMKRLNLKVTQGIAGYTHRGWQYTSLQNIRSKCSSTHHNISLKCI